MESLSCLFESYAWRLSCFTCKYGRMWTLCLQETCSNVSKFSMVYDSSFTFLIFWDSHSKSNMKSFFFSYAKILELKLFSGVIWLSANFSHQKFLKFNIIPINHDNQSSRKPFQDQAHLEQVKRSHHPHI